MTMHRPITKTAAETMLALQFAALATCDPDRVAAFAAFEAEGLPTRRNEAWHYTDLRSAMTEAAPLAPAPDARRIAGGARAAGDARADRRRQVRHGFRRPLCRGIVRPPARGGHGLPPRDIGSLRGASRRCRRLERCFRPSGLTLLLDDGIELAERLEIAHFVSSRRAAVGLFARRDHIGAGARARIHESLFRRRLPGAQRNALMTIGLGEVREVQR